MKKSHTNIRHSSAKRLKAETNSFVSTTKYVVPLPSFCVITQ